jgi:hypothetical protein
MNFKRLIPFALLCGSSLGYGQAHPLVQPMWQFVDETGSPCVGCKLYSFLAGTSTQTPTYTDYLEVSQNPNPIILNAAGEAQIWVGTPTIKLVLKHPDGSLIWTVDHIPTWDSGGGGAGCTAIGASGVIQGSNGTGGCAAVHVQVNGSNLATDTTPNFVDTAAIKVHNLGTNQITLDGPAIKVDDVPTSPVWPVNLSTTLPAPDAGYINAIPRQDGAANISFEVPATSTPALEMKPVPPITGTYAIIHPTGSTGFASGYCANPFVSGSNSSVDLLMAAESSTFPPSDCHITWTFTGALAAQAPQITSTSHITAVYGFAFDSLRSDNATNGVDVASGGIQLTPVAGPRGSWPMQQFTGLTGLTGANFEASTATAGISRSGVSTTSPTELIVGNIGYMIFYNTDPPPAADNALNVLPPLVYDPNLKTLGVDANFPAGLISVQAAQLATLFPPGANVSNVFLVRNALNSTDCSAGGGTTVNLCVSNGTSYSVFSAGGGGGGGVTNVATDATMTGGPITTTGTLGVNLANAFIWTASHTFNLGLTIASGHSLTNTGVADGCGTWASGVLGSTGTPCGSGGGGSGTVSGQAANVIGKATNATTTGAQSALSDNGTTVTSTEPIAVTAIGASQIALTYNATPVVPGSGTTAVYGVDSSGHAVGSEAGGAASRFCTAANGVCAAGTSTEVWDRMGVVIGAQAGDANAQVLEPSAMWDSSPEVLTNDAEVVKMEWTTGWWPTAGGGRGIGLCFGESADGIQPPKRIQGGCPLAATVNYGRGYMLPTRQSGNLVVLATNINTGSGDIFTGTTMAGLTKTTTGAMSCGGSSIETANSLQNWAVVNTSGNNWTAIYECQTSAAHFQLFKATSTTGYTGSYTKAGAPVIGNNANTIGGNCLSASGVWLYYDGTKLWAAIHCGTSDPLTPYIYIGSSTDNGSTWTFPSRPNLTVQNQNEGIGSSLAQIADPYILPDFSGAQNGGNRVTMYYDAIENSCVAPTCVVPSYINAVTINDTLANVLANGSIDGGNFRNIPEIQINTNPISLNDAPNFVSNPLSEIQLVDQGKGTVAVGHYTALDYFQGTATTALTSHTDTYGNTYAQYTNNNSSPQGVPTIQGTVNPGTAELTTGASPTYGDVLSTLTPVTTDYTVTARCWLVTSTGECGVFARASSAAATHYYANINGTGAITLFKTVAGTPTTLGTATFVIPTNVALTLSLQVSGTSTTTLKVYLGNVLELTATDSSSPITAVGQAGFRITGNSRTIITMFSVQQAATAVNVTGVSPVVVTPSGTTYAVSCPTCSTGSASAMTNITGSVTATGCTVSNGVCTVSGSTTSVVTFSVIPGTFNHLKMIFNGIGDSTWQSVPLTINADTSAHYADEGYFVTGTGTITGLSAVSATACKGLYLAASGAVAGSAEFLFPFYAQTSFGKTVVQEMMSYPSVSSATNNGALHSTCLWNQTSAITSFTSTVGSGHFAAGSSFTLYGIN